MRTVFLCVLCSLVAACAAGPSPEKIAAMKAECASQKTPVAYAKCANEVEQREAPDPYPELANIVYAARLDLAAKVERKEITPEAAQLQFAQLVAQVHDEERRRTAAALDNFGQRLQNAGRALQSIQ